MYSKNNKSLIIELKIPQMGEGLKEVKILKLFKQVGDVIKEDEIIYEMETEKSIVEIESPYNGFIKTWFVKEGEVLEVGSILGIIETESRQNWFSCKSISGKKSVKKEPRKKRTSLRTTSPYFNNSIKQKDIRFISPRVRAYCRKLNLKDEIIVTIPCSGKTLTIKDVDKFISPT